MTAKTLYTARPHTTEGRGRRRPQLRRAAGDHPVLAGARPGRGPIPNSCSPPAGRPASSGRWAWSRASRRSPCRRTRPSTPRSTWPPTTAAISLRARLKVSLPGVDRDVARSIVEHAHQVCPYSKATRGNIDVEIDLV